MPEPPVDITRVPNFGALREYLGGTPARDAVAKWVDKLEAWCTEIREELTKHDKALDAARGQILALEEESVATADINARLESLEEELRDVERGVITFEELMQRRAPIHV